MSNEEINNVIPLETSEIFPPPYEEASRLADGIPPTSHTLEFDFESFGLVQEESDCLATCIAMCAIYWRVVHRIDVGSTTNRRYWSNFIKTFKRGRGTSINLIYNRLRHNIVRRRMFSNRVMDLGQFFQTEEPPVDSDTVIDSSRSISSPIINPLKVQQVFLSRISDVIPFYNSDFQIPIIIIYNHHYLKYGRTGNHHAVVLYRVDFSEREIIVIDPQIINTLANPPHPLLQTYSMRSFYEAWTTSGFGSLLIYPKELEVSIKYSESEEGYRKEDFVGLDKFLNDDISRTLEG